MYFESWKTAWDFQKQFVDMPDDEESWKTFFEERDRILQEHENDLFLSDLISCIWNELRRQAKAVR